MAVGGMFKSFLQLSEFGIPLTAVSGSFKSFLQLSEFGIPLTAVSGSFKSFLYQPNYLNLNPAHGSGRIVQVLTIHSDLYVCHE
jgi:hypothetical protein